MGRERGDKTLEEGVRRGGKGGRSEPNTRPANPSVRQALTEGYGEGSGAVSMYRLARQVSDRACLSPYTVTAFSYIILMIFYFKR